MFVSYPDFTFAAIFPACDKAGWTKFTSGLMIFNEAGRIIRTSVALTRINTLQLRASFIGWTARVLETDEDGRFTLGIITETVGSMTDDLT